MRDCEKDYTEQFEDLKEFAQQNNKFCWTLDKPESTMSVGSRLTKKFPDLRILLLNGPLGAGKTTLSKNLGNSLKKIGIPCILLDGDTIRSIFSEDKDNRDYTNESRKRMAMKYSRLSLLLASQGYCVITSVIGMFKEIYSWNKKYLPGYYEIFLDIPISELKKRDPKGIYRKFSLGKFCLP